MIRKVICILALACCLYKAARAQDTNAMRAIIASGRDRFEKIKALNQLCESAWMQGNYDEARTLAARAFELEARELSASGNKAGVLKERAYTYNNLAIIHRFKGNYSASLDNHLKALKIREAIKDTRGIARSNLGLGSIYDFLGEKRVALNYKFRARQLFEEVKDTLFTGFTCNHIAGIYFDLGKTDSAELYNRQALEIFTSKSNLTGMSDAYTLAGRIFEERRQYDEAISNYKSSLQSALAFGLKDRCIGSYTDLGSIHIHMGRLPEAKQYIHSALLLARQTGAKFHMSEIYGMLHQIDSLQGHFASALQNYKLSVTYEDSLINQKSSEKIALLQSEFEHEKTEAIRRLEEEKKEEARRGQEERQKRILYSALAVLGLVLVFLAIIFRSYRQKQRINSQLLAKNDIIEKQKRLVEEKQTEILDSINYAKRIQYALLANKKLLDEHLKDYFLFFRPKDVVSGDVYWASSLSGGRFLLLTADSTGHGVPGAIMSMLNISCLSEAVNAGNLPGPAAILNATRKKIIGHLSNDGSSEGGKDGMDCSLICLDLKQQKLWYAAANNPVWIVRNNSCIPLAADRMPVGRHDKDQVPFTEHEMSMAKGDMIYTFTDGFADQFGGPKGKKFKYRQLEELLVSIAGEPTAIQKQKLDEAFQAWKGDLEQVDDICVIGIRV